jgi:hypothetical protein
MFKKPTNVYRPILKKAWEVTRQNKFLWVFGLFAALAGNGGVYEILIKGFERVVSRGEIFLGKTSWLWQWSIFTWPRLENTYETSPLFVSVFWLLFTIVLIILGVVIWLNITSRGALINCARKIVAKRKTDIRDGFAAGNKYFWQVLGLNILAKALIFGLLVLITIPVMFFVAGGGNNFGLNLFLFILSFVLFTILAIFISFMTIYASCFVVIKGLPFVEAIRASWYLFIKNWLVSVEVALLLFLITLGVGAGLVLLSLFYLFPVALLLAAFAYLELNIGFWAIIFLATLGWLGGVLWAGAMLSTFQFSTWTILFLELNKKKIWSKLLRFVGIGK